MSMKAKRVLNIIFFGPQGSGKGTQAKILAKKLGMRHLSSGEALRSTARANTPLGRYLRRQLVTGRLTPIPKLLEVFEVFIRKIPHNTGIIFDGFARQITETKIFLRRLKKLGRHINATVMIDISEKETVKRLSKRLQCSSCNRLFIASSKLRAGGKCPNCRGSLFIRPDDKPAAIRKRLNLYRKRTMVVIKFFQKQGLLVKINGEQSVAAVQGEIIKALKRRKLVS